jgi:hypothetical protein
MIRGHDTAGTQRDARVKVDLDRPLASSQRVRRSICFVGRGQHVVQEPKREKAETGIKVGRAESGVHVYARQANASLSGK